MLSWGWDLALREAVFSSEGFTVSWGGETNFKASNVGSDEGGVPNCDLELTEGSWGGEILEAEIPFSCNRLCR